MVLPAQECLPSGKENRFRPAASHARAGDFTLAQLTGSKDSEARGRTFSQVDTRFLSLPRHFLALIIKIWGKTNKILGQLFRIFGRVANLRQTISGPAHPQRLV